MTRHSDIHKNNIGLFVSKMQLHTAVLGLLWALIAYIIYSLVSGYLQRQRYAALAKEWGCQEPPWQYSKYPFKLGIDIIQRSLKADREKLFPPDFAKRVEEIGANTFRFALLGTDGVFTCEPKNIQAILATQFQDYDLGPIRRSNLFPLLGDGIFTQDGKAWEHSRAMMRPQFARDQVSDLDLEEVHSQNMMRALPAGPDGWTSKVDLSVLFFRLTLDSATEFLFGESVDSQLAMLPTKENPHPTEHDDSEFAFAFDASQRALSTRARFGDKPWMYSPKSFIEACNKCHEFIDHFVRLALSKELRTAELEKRDGDKKEKYIFLEALAQQTRDPIELRSQLLNILLAGRDTTASLLGWLFFALARDPAHYQKLRKVIIDEFGTYEKPKNITFSSLKSCSYLQQNLNEALRLYPVVPVNSRRANKDTTLPTGGGAHFKSPIFIPKGTEVNYSVHVMQRRKDLWGQDADEFKPERFEGRKHGWEFLPVSPFAFCIILTEC